jgi:hypothetical protein
VLGARPAHRGSEGLQVVGDRERGAGALAELAEAAVNGQPGLVAELDGAVATVFAFDVAADKITRVWIIRNPNKLSRWADRAT